MELTREEIRSQTLNPETLQLAVQLVRVRWTSPAMLVLLPPRVQNLSQ